MLLCWILYCETSLPDTKKLVLSKGLTFIPSAKPHTPHKLLVLGLNHAYKDGFGLYHKKPHNSQPRNFRWNETTNSRDSYTNLVICSNNKEVTASSTYPPVRLVKSVYRSFYTMQTMHVECELICIGCVHTKFTLTTSHIECTFRKSTSIGGLKPASGDVMQYFY